MTATTAATCIEVTPTLAREWLAQHALKHALKNQHVGRGLVRALVAAIRAGEWDPTLRVTCIGPTGIERGVHRLLALVQAEQTLPMFVHVHDQPLCGLHRRGHRGIR